MWLYLSKGHSLHLPQLLQLLAGWRLLHLLLQTEEHLLLYQLQWVLQPHCQQQT